MNIRGFFINLDRSIDRRAQMESHLASHGLGDYYRRFPAANGNPLNFPNPNNLLVGELGCFTSHYLLLKENIGSTAPLHVVEDDVIFSRFTASVIGSLLANNSFDDFDIIYLDSFVLTSTVMYREFHRLFRQCTTRDANGKIQNADFQLIDMKTIEFASTASMMISPRSIQKLHDLYHAQLTAGTPSAIDLFLRRKVQDGTLKVGCIFPFVTSLRLDSVFGTTMEEHDLRLIAMATLIARHAFFVEADWDQCLEYAQRYLNAPPDDKQRQVLTHILGFALDDRFQFR
jgi:GR25 family glycosyltransferase involved in LPS biosynthesis